MDADWIGCAVWEVFFCQKEKDTGFFKLPFCFNLCQVKRSASIYETASVGLTGPRLDASLGARHGEDGEAVVILGAAGLDGADVAVAAGTEHTRKI